MSKLYELAVRIEELGVRQEEAERVLESLGDARPREGGELSSLDTLFGYVGFETDALLPAIRAISYPDAVRKLGQSVGTGSYRWLVARSTRSVDETIQVPLPEACPECPPAAATSVVQDARRTSTEPDAVLMRISGPPEPCWMRCSR